MTDRSEIPPSTLGVELREEGVAVEYIDGRTVFYHGVPQKATGTLETAPGKDVHVLVTDESETEGVMVYVNDLKTNDDILDATGVGRVILDKGETASVFPGVEVTRTGFRFQVDPDHDAIEGRVFVFEEDEMSELSHEIVPE